ncbi:MAG: ABC transporter substrate-binding protein [Burkholderiales bacterium PBB5]|nr:MAG: ABC transporter substrate-binding protein [Burkholderiales bacterium PBB5]
MHTPSRRHFLGQLSAAGLTATLAVPGRAEPPWPQGPLRQIVPFPAGGATDILARLLGRGITTRTGQQVLVDNRAGAGGMIGTAALAKSPPDGLNFGIVLVTTTITAPFIYEKVPYDVDRELAFVSLLCTVPMVLAVHPSLPANTLAELVQHVRRNPGKLSYGSVATGHYGHVASEHLNVTLNGGMVHVPYTGEAPMLQDLLGGQLPLSFVTIATARTHVEAGRLRLLAITGTRRHPSMPQVHTFAEAGQTAEVFKMNPGWLGLAAPAKTPTPLIQRMAAETVSAARDPETLERIGSLGMDFVGSTPEAFGETYRREKPVWQQLLQQAGIRPS